MRKSVIALVSNSSGAYLKTWQIFTFGGFDKQLYGGLGECVLTLPVPFDYAGSDLILGNNVELRVSDEDTVASNTKQARIIYRGYISLIERDLDAGNESVRVHLLGDYTRLSLDFLKNGSQTTLYSTSTGLTTTSGSNAAGEVGMLAKAVMDRYAAETTNPRLFYNAGSMLPDVSNNSAKYIFQQMTYRDALDKLVSMATVGTFYYIDELGIVHFRSPSSTPVHKFTQGRHFSQLHIEQSLETVRNGILIWNGKTSGSIYKHYEDAASILKYGRRVDSQNNYGIAASGAADNQGARFLARRKSPDLKVTCTIFDNNENDFGYDIESINPGDTCSFYGFSANAGILFQDNMIITAVRYTLDSAQITVEFVNSALIDVQNQQGVELSDLGTAGIGIPDSYT